jgi:hypothetical protein
VLAGKTGLVIGLLHDTFIHRGYPLKPGQLVISMG